MESSYSRRGSWQRAERRPAPDDIPAIYRPLASELPTQRQDLFRYDCCLRRRRSAGQSLSLTSGGETPTCRRELALSGGGSSGSTPPT